MTRTIFISFIAFLFATNICHAQNTGKHRLIVLTDIENEPDDSESLVRLLLYSNQIDIEGIIATTSVHMKNRVAPETILKTIDAYDKVRDNLLLHESGWPTADELRTKVKSGIAKYGMTGVGKNCDSEGSELIINMLKEDDNRPLWISVWGGVNTLAQALFTINERYTSSDAEKMMSKLRVYTISDQDDSGIWIRKNYPNVFYIVSPGGYGNGSWSGMMDDDTNSRPEFISNTWIAKNIQQDHGPLGARYPDVAYGIEGDTPSWLSLIPNGLNNPEHPEWGGWGGRYEYYKPKYESLDLNGFNGGVPIEEEPHAIWTNAIDSFYVYYAGEYGRAVVQSKSKVGGYKATVWRWRPEVQNDFAGRMDWCYKSYAQANHAPIPVLGHSEMISVKSGQWFELDATNSTDPDGDNLSFLWFCYPEAGSFKGDVNIDGAENIYHVKVKAPIVNAPQTVHFILKVTDKGTPQMTSYKRVVVTIMP